MYMQLSDAVGPRGCKQQTVHFLDVYLLQKFTLDF